MCLADARRRGFDETLVLGDIVGYGADPNAVVARVQELKPGRSCAATTTRSPAASNRLTASTPSRAPQRNGRSRCSSRSTGRGWRRCRRDRWRSTTSSRSATDRRSTKTSTSSTRPTRCAHSKACRGSSASSATPTSPLPFSWLVVNCRRWDRPPQAEAILELRTDVLYLVNPGAVGQPRDGDARAAYAIVDVDAETGGVGAARLPDRRGAGESRGGGAAACAREAAGGGTRSRT